MFGIKHNKTDCLHSEWKKKGEKTSNMRLQRDAVKHGAPEACRSTKPGAEPFGTAKLGEHGTVPIS